jgi:hypothetical protein
MNAIEPTPPSMGRAIIHSAMPPPTFCGIGGGLSSSTAPIGIVGGSRLGGRRKTVRATPSPPSCSRQSAHA